MTSPQSYRVTIKKASALAILESLMAMQAIGLEPEPGTGSRQRADIQSLRGSVKREAGEAMLRHTELARNGWEEEDLE